MEKQYVYGHCEGCGRTKSEGCNPECKFNTPNPMKDTQDHWQEELKEELEEQLYTMLRMTSLMQPKSDEEFIAVALPNLHIFAQNFIQSVLEHEREEAFAEGVRDEAIVSNGRTTEALQTQLRELCEEVERMKRYVPEHHKFLSSIKPHMDAEYNLAVDDVLTLLQQRNVTK